MGQRKRAHTRQPSIIRSSIDWQFSPSKQTLTDNPSSLPDSDSDSSGLPVSPRPSAKRPRRCSNTSTASASENQRKNLDDAPGRCSHALPSTTLIFFAALTPSKKLMYMVLAFLAAKMKKALSKRVAKSYTLQLDTGEPWDTMQAQLLSKIDNALQPQPLDFTLFDISYTIPRIVPKPRMPLETEASYSILLQHIHTKAKEPPIISISICQKGAARQQEDLSNANNDKGKKKSRDPATLPGNMKKNENMKALQERWVCPKKQASCLGMHCFINKEDKGWTHLPLSHERLDCWAAAMVSACVYMTLGLLTRTLALAQR